MNATGRVVRRTLAAVAMAGLGLVGLTTPAHADDVTVNVGRKCYDNREVGQTTLPAACVWMNVDHTNDRIRAYASATQGTSVPSGRIAVRYLRLQQLGADKNWRDIPGTMSNDLDGWWTQDDAASPLWRCAAAGGTGATVRALVQFQNENAAPVFATWSNYYTFSGFTC